MLNCRVLFSKNKASKSTYSDEQLILEFCKTKHLDTLGELYNRYLHLVYGVCLKYLKNREDSQDAVIQIFEILVNEVPKHKIRVFKSWLHGVSRNFCLMKLRKDASVKLQQNSFTDDFFVEKEFLMHPIDENPADLTQLLQQCIALLKEKQKQCIQLFYFEQKCYREIALELLIEEKQVKSLVQNAKRNLKICVQRKEKVSHV